MNNKITFIDLSKRTSKNMPSPSLSFINHKNFRLKHH
jgi:hypothetical protein